VFIIYSELFKSKTNEIIIEKQIRNFNVLIEQDEDVIYIARVSEIEGGYTPREKH